MSVDWLTSSLILSVSDPPATTKPVRSPTPSNPIAMRKPITAPENITRLFIVVF